MLWGFPLKKYGKVHHGGMPEDNKETVHTLLTK